jgi:hypothetical protein
MLDNEPHTGLRLARGQFRGHAPRTTKAWSQLPLENILLAIEETQDTAQMQDTAQQLGTGPAGEHGESVRSLSVKEPPVECGETGTDHGVDSQRCCEPRHDEATERGMAR